MGTKVMATQSQQHVKRIFDVIVSFIALVLLLPAMLVVAAGIRLTSRGPALFAQLRTGKDRHTFRIYKFRTMYRHFEDPSDVFRPCLTIHE